MFSIASQLNNQSLSNINQDDNLAQSCRKKYPSMIPIKIQTQQGITISKHKFLISQTVTGLQLQRSIQKYIQSQMNSSLYFFVIDKSKRRLLQTNILLKQPYEMYKNQNGFLMLIIMKQNSF